MGRHFFSLLGIVLSLVLSSLAHGYPTPVDFDGSILRWHISAGDEPITYEVKASNENDLLNFQNEVDDSATIWNSVANSYFQFGPVNGDEPAQVTVNLERAIDGGSVSSGYAIFDGYENKKPTHCSIHVLIEDNMSQYSIAKTILHELGHCLGLGHSLIPESIMSYQLDKNTYGLDIDDEAAISRLYPIDGSKPELPPGCSIGPIRDKKAWFFYVFLVLPVLICLGSRKNHRSLRNR